MSSIITDKNEVRRILNEQYNQKGRYVVVKLPCGHATRQINKPIDQMIQCPVCLKRCVLMWQKKRVREI